MKSGDAQGRAAYHRRHGVRRETTENNEQRPRADDEWRRATELTAAKKRKIGGRKGRNSEP
jgi:hypothetical protein